MRTIAPQQLVHHRIPKGALCLSIYANSIDDLKLKLRQCRTKAAAERGQPKVEQLFRPVRKLIAGLENEPVEFPMGVFVTQGLSCKMKMPIEVQSLGVLAESFHVKPLLKWMQREHPFSLLLLEETKATLYQGTLSTFKEEEVVTYKELRTMDGIFGALDRAIYRTIQSTRTPLILAGDSDLADHYRNVSGYKAIVEDFVPHSSGQANLKALHEAAKELLEPYLERKEEALLSQFRSAELNGRTAGSLQEIILFSLKQKVKHLFVSEGMNIWGKIDIGSGCFTYSPQQPNASEDDVLDDLAEIVIRGGGTVTVLPGEKMPYGHLACAILQGVDPASRFQRQKINSYDHDETYRAS